MKHEDYQLQDQGESSCWTHANVYEALAVVRWCILHTRQHKTQASTKLIPNVYGCDVDGRAVISDLTAPHMVGFD
jgi:hypothetical protein